MGLFVAVSSSLLRFINEVKYHMRPEHIHVQSTLVVSTSLISNNHLSRSEDFDSLI